MPTSALWEHYENEYVDISRKVAQRLQESEPSALTLQALEADLDSARSILNQMEIAVMANSHTSKEEERAARAKLEAFRSDLNKFQADAITLRKEQRLVEMKSARQKLFSDFSSDLDVEAGFPQGHPPDPDNPTARLLDQSNVRLERSQRMAQEAEQAGASILTDLRKQREQLRNASRVLRETDQDLDTSNRMVREMLRRMKTNKYITMGIISLLGFAILLVVYSKLFR